jgi:asparagine synthase (glutamine-hydrolysing)
MCGLAGFLCYQWPGDRAEAQLGSMTSAIRARGPDSHGHWLDPNEGIAIGHRRLAVVDLTVAGAQPMRSASGRYIIAFNGEIYNHLDCRAALEANGNVSTTVVAWRGHSDTETLLAGFDAWGIQGTVERCVGMFAFAVWDREKHTLTLGRDRMGEKPLYYGWQGTGRRAAFLFGSELKALRQHPAFRGQISTDALCCYMQSNNIGGTSSIYQGIHKLLPGGLLTVSLQVPMPVCWTYWSAIDAAKSGVEQPFEGSASEAVDALEVLLKDAVGKQMMSDVPVGAFLSGGVDSSTIVALMQVQSPHPVKTFTIGFTESAYNEAHYARKVARHLGTDHIELYVTPGNARDVVPLLPSMYDEPFADSSQIPTFLVSQLARQHVTVSLSGDGGDELFCGYNRYLITSQLWRYLSSMPVTLRNLLARTLNAISPLNLDRIVGLMPGTNRWANLAEKLHKGAEVMSAASDFDLYVRMKSQWPNPSEVVRQSSDSALLSAWPFAMVTDLTFVEKMMLSDLLSYLPDDILVKVDRAAMSVSLETRVPYLDHRVVDFAWQLPLKYKLPPGGSTDTTKWVLRQVLYRHVPPALIERPKAGFGVPIDAWLRGPLREWAEDLLSESRLKRDGYFNPAPIRAKWAEHLAGHHNWQHQLWCVLTFQCWLANQSS